MVPETYPMVTLSGSHHAIGRQHGALLRDRVHHHLDVAVRRLEARAGLSRAEAMAKALRYRPYVERYAPELAEEIRGVADGAGIQLGEAYILQLRAELTRPLTDDLTQECTTFAILPEATATGEPLAGQNADLAPFYREVAAVVRIVPERYPPVLMLTPAGQVSYIGLNAAGLAVFANFLTCDGWRLGLPRYLFTRLMLRHATVPEAVAAVAEVPRASSRNLIAIDCHGHAADVETTPTAHAVLTPEDGLLAHSNHYVSPALAEAERAKPRNVQNSRLRLARMQDHLRAHRGRLSVAALQAILRDRTGAPDALCRYPGEAEDDTMTFASVIAEPARRQFWAAVGPPDGHAYVRYQLAGE
jgi:isopenicillin-N N-acyltransferase-like protein